MAPEAGVHSWHSCWAPNSSTWDQDVAVGMVGDPGYYQPCETSRSWHLKTKRKGGENSLSKGSIPNGGLTDKR